ncbi:unnamed protein product, partial [Symbiodinium sp. CCMP2456]
MVVLRGQAFALWGWPCSCFEGPDHKERQHIEPYEIDLQDENPGPEDGIILSKPRFIRSSASALDALGPLPAGKALRRVVAEQLQKLMDNTTYFYRGNILELAYGSAHHVVPLGVTVLNNVSSHKQ